jgi:hypothetical protein
MYTEGCKRRTGTCTRPCCVVQRKPESDEEDEENEPPPPPAKQQRISPAPAASSSSSSLATVPDDTSSSEILLGPTIMVGQKVKLNFPAGHDNAGRNGEQGSTVAYIPAQPPTKPERFEVELKPEKGEKDGKRVRLKPGYLLPFAPKPIPQRPAELPARAIDFSQHATSNYRSAGDEAERVFALANEYDQARDHDLRGYVAMEKYDGVRAMWEGPQRGFRTRGGGPYP